MITREKLLARIADLESQKEAAVAQINAIMGAIQDCQFWIAQLEGKGNDEVVPGNPDGQNSSV